MSAYGKSRPSRWFETSEDALAVLCRGCDWESGWLEDPSKPMPACARDVMNDEPGAVGSVGGTPCCPERARREDARRKRELALYERRMRGDWS